MDYGFISVYIDGFTPCLKDNATGELIDTEVIRIKRSSFLEKYNKKAQTIKNQYLKRYKKYETVQNKLYNLLDKFIEEVTQK